MTDQNPPQDQTTDETTQDTNQTPQTNSPLAAKILELEQQLNEANQKADEMTGAAQRALADLQNFKRRTEEERSRFAQMASAGIVNAILPHLDNFHRAFEHAPESNEWAESIKKITQDLEASLAAQGLQKIEVVGQKLDPNQHEALLQGPGEKDIIIEELEPGYMLGQYVVKPAKVKVGNGEAA